MPHLRSAIKVAQPADAKLPEDDDTIRTLGAYALFGRAVGAEDLADEEEEDEEYRTRLRFRLSGVQSA